MEFRRRPPPGGVAADTASQRELAELHNLPTVVGRNYPRVVGRLLTFFTQSLQVCSAKADVVRMILACHPCVKNGGKRGYPPFPDGDIVKFA
jgi:hypothetical protein